MATELRAAFQRGSDIDMLAYIIDGNMREMLVEALFSASDRTLTYSAPQIASLCERVGWLGDIEKKDPPPQLSMDDVHPHKQEGS
jgi:hypothetical protein